MTHSTLCALLLATPALAPLLETLLPHLAQLAGLLEDFRHRPVTPEATYDLEQALQKQSRELSRQLLAGQLNQLEPQDAPQTPRQLCQDGNRYRRRDKHKNTIASLSGSITLWRFLYEPNEAGERCIHPLEQRLGIVAGCATPALAERAGLACADESQRAALDRLARDHGVHWSADTYRKVTQALAAGLAPQRQPAQVEKVLAWLSVAQASTGRHRPVLAAGRDGVQVPIRDGEYHEGATATLSVFDRRGKRLGTVYLGRMPEPGQPTLTVQLTDLLRAVLLAWEGPTPRLAYITDGGWHPSDYYRRVLRKMEDPRRPGHRLAWERVIDLYHAYGYVTQLAEALFGDSKAGREWARRMRRLLRDGARGWSRVLQAAAYQRNQGEPTGKRAQAYEQAHGYLRRQGRFMDYAGYRRRGLPVGSGVTEAACKTVFTQRLKRSGMRWGGAGGQVALDLRVLRLSGVWDSAFRKYLRCLEDQLSVKPIQPTADTHDTHTANTQEKSQNAA
jgi:hypothetical protein